MLQRTQADVPAEEQRDPCASCRGPSVWGGFWGHRLCESCWGEWKSIIDAAADRRQCDNPGQMFRDWLRAKGVQTKPELGEECDTDKCSNRVSEQSGFINGKRMCNPCFDEFLAKAYPNAAPTQEAAK